ncbi:MAG: hypothetical protein AABY18_00285 [Candidatus Thermoplasmatota archaeon]
MAKEKGELVGVVREWKPEHDDSLTKIHAAIDSWGRRPDHPPQRDYADVEAAVDRITKRVKTRKVTVHETVTEYVDEEQAPIEGPADDGVQQVEAPKSSKRKPKILGWFGPKSQKKKVDDAVAERAAGNGAADADYQPQCSALTEDGQQCRNSARGESKYCSSHKGYQPPTAKGIAKRVEGEAWDPSDHVTDRSSVRAANTRPKVRKAKDTKVAVRKVAKSGRKKR